MRFALAGLLAALLAFALPGRAELPVPELRERVTDLTATLTPEQRAGLEESLRAFETLKGAQLAVLLVHSTEPETIDQYGIRVAEAWKLGRADVDDGLLLVVAKDDRRMRIEVGYGLEGVLPDAIAKRVIAETITPHFKRGEYHEGIDAGMQQLMRIIDGEPLPPPAVAPANTGMPDLLVFGFFFLIVAGTVLRGVFGRLLGSGIAGGIMGAIVWSVSQALLVAVGAALLMFVLVLVFGGARGRRGGWHSGGFGGGLGGGGGFGGGGGGFGGGGGGFGGGGASGGW